MKMSGFSPGRVRKAGLAALVATIAHVSATMQARLLPCAAILRSQQARLHPLPPVLYTALKREQHLVPHSHLRCFFAHSGELLLLGLQPQHEG